MISGVDKKHAASIHDDHKRKRQRYCDKYYKDAHNDDEDDDNNDDGDVENEHSNNNIHDEDLRTRSSYSQKSLQIVDNYNDDEENEHEHEHERNAQTVDNNYNCHYKIKSVPMSAIRCRLEEQQHHLHHQQQQQQQQHQQQQHQQHQHQHQHTVINLARSSHAVPSESSSETAGLQQGYNLSTSQSTSHVLHYENSTSNSTYKTENSTSTHQTAMPIPSTSTTPPTMPSSAESAAAANRRDHNIDYSTLFVQLSGTLPTLYRCVNCNKIVSNRWHHANIHRPQSHVCPVCGQKFTRRDNMKAHCKIKHADIKDRFFSHYVHM